MSDDAKKTVILVLIVLAFCTVGLVIATIVDALKSKDTKPETAKYEYTCKECGYHGIYEGVEGYGACLKCGANLSDKY